MIPTPSVDFDPSEVAVSWQVLAQAGDNVVFATPNGEMARGDEVMLRASCFPAATAHEVGAATWRASCAGRE